MCLPAPQINRYSPKYTCVCPEEQELAADGLRCRPGESWCQTVSFIDFFFSQLFVLVYTHSTRLPITSCILQTFNHFFILYMYNFRTLRLHYREMMEKRDVLNLNSVLPFDPTLALSFPVILLFKSSSKGDKKEFSVKAK